MTHPAIVFKDALHSAVLDLIRPDAKPYPRVPSRAVEARPDGLSLHFTPDSRLIIKPETFKLHGVRDHGDYVMAFVTADAVAEGVSYSMEYRVGGSAVTIILDYANRLEAEQKRSEQGEGQSA